MLKKDWRKRKENSLSGQSIDSAPLDIFKRFLWLYDGNGTLFIIFFFKKKNYFGNKQHHKKRWELREKTNQLKQENNGEKGKN